MHRNRYQPLNHRIGKLMEYLAFPNVKTVLRDLYGMEPKVLSPVGQNAIALMPIKAAAGRVRTTLLAEFRSLLQVKLT